MIRMKASEDLKTLVIGIGSFGCEFIEYLFTHESDFFNLTEIERDFVKSGMNYLSIRSEFSIWNCYSYSLDIASGRLNKTKISIEPLLSRADLIFLVVDMKEGASAEMLRHLAASTNQITSSVTILIGIMPLMSAGMQERSFAENMVDDLVKHVDIVVPLQPELIEERFKFNKKIVSEEEKKKDAILFVIHSITDYAGPMRIGCDFTDLRQAFGKKRFAKVGFGISNSPNDPGQLAAEMAMKNWLTTECHKRQVYSTFINFYGSKSLFPTEFMKAHKVVTNNDPEDSYSIIGAPICAMPTNEVLVVVIAAGFELVGVNRRRKQRQEKGNF